MVPSRKFYMMINFVWKFNVILWTIAWESIPFCLMQLCEVFLWRYSSCTPFIILLWTNFPHYKFHGLVVLKQLFLGMEGTEDGVNKIRGPSKIESFTCFSIFDGKVAKFCWQYAIFSMCRMHAIYRYMLDNLVLLHHLQVENER